MRLFEGSSFAWGYPRGSGLGSGVAREVVSRRAAWREVRLARCAGEKLNGTDVFALDAFSSVPRSDRVRGGLDGFCRAHAAHWRALQCWFEIERGSRFDRGSAWRHRVRKTS